MWGVHNEDECIRIDLKEVGRFTGLSKLSIYKGMNEGCFKSIWSLEVAADDGSQMICKIDYFARTFSMRRYYHGTCTTRNSIANPLS
jgi:hypothetical protein